MRGIQIKRHSITNEGDQVLVTERRVVIKIMILLVWNRPLPVMRDKHAFCPSGVVLDRTYSGPWDVDKNGRVSGVKKCGTVYFTSI